MPSSSKVIPRALTIAGSDSGGGAGIEADLKTFTALGVYGMVALTSITAQNTYEVRAVFDLPPEIVEKQIECVVEDIGVDAAKTGMLSNSGIIRAVARTVRRYGFPLVVDPVLVAKSGAPLLKPEAFNTLVKEIIPLAKVVTPNRPEAEKLSGVKIESIEDAKRAAKRISEEYGVEAVVVKGGHIAGSECVDILYFNGVFREFRSRRIETKNTHGGGCCFSAAITAELAKGKSIVEAVKLAKEFITLAIEYGLTLGRGFGPVNPVAWIAIPAEKHYVLENLRKAVELIEEHGELVSKLIPEVQMNIAMSLPKPYAKSVRDVAAIPGRIVRLNGKVKASSPPEFGASKHVARAVLKAMEYNPNIRAAANIRYSEDILKAVKELGYTISFYDRRKEPPEVKAREGASIPWGISEAVKAFGGKVPDVVYHLGDWGKEPMITVFGRDAVEVALKIIRIAKKLREM